MKLDYTDAELADFADWAEAQERSEPAADWKKAYGAIRQGADWLLRCRTKKRQFEIESSDRPLGKTVKQ